LIFTGSALEKTDPILFVPPVHWNYYPYRDQELPATLAERGYSCIYLNPVAYRGSEGSMRFKQVRQRRTHHNVRVIQRTSRLGKSLLEFIWENMLNVRAIRKYKPAAVISSDHLMSAGACLYCRLRGIPFIFDVTDNWEEVDKSMAGRIYKSFLKPVLARFSHAVTCTSQRQYNDFLKRRKDQTVLISNGINPQLLAGLEEEKSRPSSGAEVNFIGSLRDWYDFELLFEVFRDLPGIELHIYGTGPLYEKLLEASLSIPNIHVRGNVDPSLTGSLLQRSLFGILPLKINELNQSTCPIKLFDYWGASRAVVSSPVEEVVRVGGESVLYASTREEYLEAINRLIHEKGLAEKLGSEGRKKVDEIHNYKHIADQFLHILNFRDLE
jgi:glycosyltransferase involved in cell wall biosynthesis